MPDIDMKLQHFISIMETICNKSVPEHKIKTHTRMRYPGRSKFLTHQIKIINHMNKESSEKVCLKTTLVEIKKKNCNNPIKRESKYRNLVYKIDIKSNLKAFFNFSKEMSSVHDKYKIGSLIQCDVSFKRNTMRISEILNGQFKSIFTTVLRHLKMNKPAEFFAIIPIMREAVIIYYTYIKEGDVILAVDEVDANSVVGPDRFPAVHFKSCQAN